MVVATAMARAIQLARSLMRGLGIVIHVLSWFIRPGGRSGSTRLARHKGGEEITSIDRRGKLTVSDDIVGQLSGWNNGSPRQRFRDHIAVVRGSLTAIDPSCDERLAPRRGYRLRSQLATLRR